MIVADIGGIWEPGLTERDPEVKKSIHDAP